MSNITKILIIFAVIGVVLSLALPEMSANKAASGSSSAELIEWYNTYLFFE